MSLEPQLIGDLYLIFLKITFLNFKEKIKKYIHIGNDVYFKYVTRLRYELQKKTKSNKI
jgi:hypothetical protein